MALDSQVLDAEAAVRARYAAAACEAQAALCCPVNYDPDLLDAIPPEILEKDYGCGDPSKYVRPGDTVLDLGSGAGKICFIAAQIAGREGRVIGIDFHEEMLALARRHQPEVAARLGFDNVGFHRARIQDLALPLDEVDAWLAEHPIRTAEDLGLCEAYLARLRREAPLVPDASVDLVLSNCVLNLVREDDREALFGEIFRVLRPGGRLAISDIVSDEPVPEEMKKDPELWSGCVSGAFRESEFLRAFERAGFHGIRLERYDTSPWRTVEGIEFRSVTVTARKGKQGPCLERRQAVIYRGPWKKVEDDDGHTLLRGERTAVCDKTYRILTGDPYGDAVIPVPPREEIPLEEALPYDCSRTALRSPAETKGEGFRETTVNPAPCGPGSGCC